MTTQEFSNTFDTLLNSYNSQTVFGEGASKADIVLDEYEKSVLLTQAQDIIVKSYFSRNNATGEGFDDSAKRQIDLSELITTNTITPDLESQGIAYDPRGKIFKMPKDVLVVLNERIKGTVSVGPEETISRNYVVVPINYKEYDRQMSKAFAQPLKKQAWRLFQGNSESVGTNTIDLKSEIIPVEGVTINEYKIRYIRRPKPIVLTDLNFLNRQEKLDIDGVSTISECELNPIIHNDILMKAVELAISTRGGGQPQRVSKDK